MREYLAPLAWCRHRFTALLGQQGSSVDGRTVVLREVACEETGQPVAEHVWTRLPDVALLAGVGIGDHIAFRATVRPYRREDGTWDYHLTGLRHVTRVARRP